MSKFLEFVKGLEGCDNVRPMDVDQLASETRPYGRQTSYGNLAYFSNVRSRSASQSVVIGSDRVREKSLSEGQAAILERLETTLGTLQEYLTRAPLIRVQRTIGDNDVFNPRCTLYLSTQRQDNVRQAYLWSKTLRAPAAGEPGSELNLVCIPEWPEHDRQVLVFPEDGLTVVLGMDYVGEVKMGFLRMAMWWAKQEGMLSLHAGSKLLTARVEDGSLKRYGMLLFGLSGTGKTTHSCHDHGLTGEGEVIEILQDDIVFLKEDGSALGTELGGFYLKTEGVRQENQPIILKGLSTPEVLFENVMVDSDGNVEMNDMTLGSNGRAVMPREALSPHISDSINMPPLDELDGLIIAFVTRRMTVLPIVSSLSSEQAAATFMLGESIETSAGDPKRAGESVRVVGTNPFMIGDEVEEGKWFYDFLKRYEDKVQCYLLNTGGIGEIMKTDARGHKVVEQKTHRVAIPEMASIIGGIARGAVQWKQEPHFGTMVPSELDSLDLDKFNLDNFYTENQAGEYAEALKLQRKEWLGKFPALPREVAEALP